MQDQPAARCADEPGMGYAKRGQAGKNIFGFGDDVILGRISRGLRIAAPTLIESDNTKTVARKMLGKTVKVARIARQTCETDDYGQGRVVAVNPRRKAEAITGRKPVFCICGCQPRRP